jgi:hypothetical protein
VPANEGTSVAIVKSNRRKIAELGSDDIRRLFKRGLDEWLRENEDEIEAKPSKDELSEMVADLVSLWQDPIEVMIDTAITQYCDVLLEPVDDEDDEEADSEEDEADED